ncbi:hypothetical protein [Spiroplasma endosymbiont of Asaphidion curtum]|uniref:hypothetical protein n=1 Tax=Spiroplasma endosymbiont of Asaphidion curtum TaxID=3066281 RepID=UPI00313BEBCB
MMVIKNFKKLLYILSLVILLIIVFISLILMFYKNNNDFNKIDKFPVLAKTEWVTYNNTNIIISRNLINKEFKTKVFFLDLNKQEMTKISWIENKHITSHLVQNNDVYFGTNNGMYILKQGEITPSILKQTDFYINAISAFDNNVYIGTDNGLYKLDNNLKITQLNDIGVDLIYIKNDDAFFLKSRDNLSLLKPNLKLNEEIKKIKIVNKHLITNFKTANLYFGTKEGAYVLKNDKIEKILDKKNINGIYEYKNNIYFATEEGAFVLKHNEIKVKQIDGTNNLFIKYFDFDENNIYFGTKDSVYILKQGSNLVEKINIPLLTINDEIKKIKINKDKLFLLIKTKLNNKVISKILIFNL